MAAEQTPQRPASSEAHWSTQDPGALPCYGAVISTDKAIQEALTRPGCAATVESVRERLLAMGIKLDDGLIEEGIRRYREGPGKNCPE
jgi:hypothetical protein